MPVQHEATTPAETAACRASATPCMACRKRGGETLVDGTIHGYGSAPRGGWQPRRLMSGDESAPTFGVELETQRLPGTDRLALTGTEAAAVALPRGHWFPTADGSVNGPEFASQPATLAYWRSITGPVGQFMRTLIHGGLRAHDGTYSCSMHVNIGRDAFDGADHLARFLRLATVNPRFTTRMAQRTHAQIASWASFDVYRDESACSRFARDYWHNGEAYTGHGAAVNLENPGRIEFRAPRGTLRLDRFMAKLEWVAAMVEFTRTHTGRVSVGAFVAWANEHRAEYPEFIAMMADLTPGRVASRPRWTAASRTTGARASVADPLAAALSAEPAHVVTSAETGSYLPSGQTLESYAALHASTGEVWTGVTIPAHRYTVRDASHRVTFGPSAGEPYCLCGNGRIVRAHTDFERDLSLWPEAAGRSLAQPSPEDICTCGSDWMSHNMMECPVRFGQRIGVQGARRLWEPVR